MPPVVFIFLEKVFQCSFAFPFFITSYPFQHNQILTSSGLLLGRTQKFMATFIRNLCLLSLRSTFLLFFRVNFFLSRASADCETCHKSTDLEILAISWAPVILLHGYEFYFLLGLLILPVRQRNVDPPTMPIISGLGTLWCRTPVEGISVAWINRDFKQGIGLTTTVGTAWYRIPCSLGYL